MERAYLASVQGTELMQSMIDFEPLVVVDEQVQFLLSLQE